MEVNEDDGKLVISQRKAKTDNQISSFKRNQVVSGIITGLQSGQHYGETISRPTFLLKEKEKEIFLNGELTFPK